MFSVQVRKLGILAFHDLKCLSVCTHKVVVNHPLTKENFKHQKENRNSGKKLASEIEL